MPAKKKEQSEDNIPAESINENTANETAAESPAAEEESKAETAVHSFEELLSAEKDRYMRLAAEYDNYRKRSQKEREALYADVRADTIVQFLPVFDDIERALKAGSPDETFKKGLEMTMNSFMEILAGFGVSVIPAVGHPFDPSLHNAMMHTEDESVGENIIVEEFHKGFLMGDKVIRYSMVKVAN